MAAIQVNVEKCIIDNELYLRVKGPLLNKTMLKHDGANEYTVDCYEQTELRSVDQNAFYFGAIVRGGMKIFHELTGETWSDGQLHAFHMQEILGVKPTLVRKGQYEFTTFDIDNKHLAAAFDRLGWDSALVDNLKPKSSKFTKAMFSALIELCIKYYAEEHQYTFHETSKGHEFRRELFGTTE